MRNAVLLVDYEGTLTCFFHSQVYSTNTHYQTMRVPEHTVSAVTVRVSERRVLGKCMHGGSVLV